MGHAQSAGLSVIYQTKTTTSKTVERERETFQFVNGASSVGRCDAYYGDLNNKIHVTLQHMNTAAAAARWSIGCVMMEILLSMYAA